MIGMILSLLCISFMTTGCGALIEADRVFNSANKESYDQGICNSGEPSRPGESVR